MGRWAWVPLLLWAGVWAHLQAAENTGLYRRAKHVSSVVVPVSSPTLVLLFNHTTALHGCLRRLRSSKATVLLDIQQGFDPSGWAISDNLWPVLPGGALTVVACLLPSRGDTIDLSRGWHLLEDLGGKVSSFQAIVILEGPVEPSQSQTVRNRLQVTNESWVLEAKTGRVWTNRFCDWTTFPSNETARDCFQNIVTTGYNFAPQMMYPEGEPQDTTAWGVDHRRVLAIARLVGRPAIMRELPADLIENVPEYLPSKRMTGNYWDLVSGNTSFTGIYLYTRVRCRVFDFSSMEDWSSMILVPGRQPNPHSLTVIAGAQANVRVGNRVNIYPSTYGT